MCVHDRLCKLSHIYYAIIGRLDAPDTTTESCGSNHLTISWNSLNSSVCGIVEYHLWLSIGDVIQSTESTMNLSYTFNRLSIHTHYSITVYGTNNAGDGEESTIFLTTKSKLNYYIMYIVWSYSSII